MPSSHSLSSSEEEEKVVPLKHASSSSEEEWNSSSEDVRPLFRPNRTLTIQEKKRISTVFEGQKINNAIQRETKVGELFPSPREPVLLEWKNLGYTIKKKNLPKSQGSHRSLLQKAGSVCKRALLKRHVLTNMTGSVAPGEFLAILGPSGAGKTTLLSILAGRVKSNVTGEVLINGVPREQTSIKYHSAFVMQEDLFFSQFTVSDTLQLTSKLVLPNSVSEKDKVQRAEDFIDLLHLRKCANTISGSPILRGLSGGEKKRLNIANELVGNATVVIMDEPTTGLDASTALMVVSILSQLARSGKTVIATLHQPSSQMFEMFDKVLILADGRTAFLGTPSDAIDHFTSMGFECPLRYNPADYLLSLLDDNSMEDFIDSKKQILDHYEEGNYGTGGVNAKPADMPQPLENKPNSEVYATSCFQQFRLLYRRGLKEHLFETAAQLFIFTMIGILVALVWWRRGYREDDINDRIGLIFFVSMQSSLIPIFTAMANMIGEKLIVKKERAAGMYRLSAYVLSRSVAHIPLDIIAPVVFSCVIYWATNLNAEASRFFIFFAFCFLAKLVGQAVGMVFGAIFEKPESGALLILTFFFLSSLLGGFYISIDRVPSWFRWTKYLSTIKYVMDALLMNEFDDPDKVFKGSPLKPGGKPTIITGGDVLSDRALIFDEIYPNALVLLGIYICAQVLAYFILRWTTRLK